jgi:hypothetical protein
MNAELETKFRNGECTMNKKMYLLFLCLLMMALSACQGDSVPTPTVDPGQMETQVAEQVAVQLTEIALTQPTATPLPTAVPATEVPSPTSTLPPTEALPTSEAASPTPMPPTPSNTPNVPTATATPSPFACQITKQKPENGKLFKPGDNFDAVWTVENTGTAAWDSTEVDYRYDSGDEFHQHDVYDLPTTVEPGESIDIIVDMLAPDDEGEYDTTWVLHRGGQLICTMEIEIEVEE